MVITSHARKHGISDIDIRHAFEHAVSAEYDDDGFTMVYGPDRAGRMIEVGFIPGDDDEAVVIHAMRSRR